MLSISDVTAANTASTPSSLVATFVYKFAVARFLNLTHFSSKDAFSMAKNYWGRRFLRWTCELLDLALQGYSLEYYFQILIFGTREDCQINININITGSSTAESHATFYPTDRDKYDIVHTAKSKKKLLTTVYCKLVCFE